MKTWHPVYAIALMSAAAAPALTGEPPPAATLETQIREALPKTPVTIDCFMQRMTLCDEAAETEDDFDHDACMATPKPPPTALEPPCLLVGDLDGDGTVDHVVSVHRVVTTEGEIAPRGLVVLEGDGDVTLFGAGSAVTLPMFFDETEDAPEESYTLGPDLDWLMAAHGLTHVEDPDLRSACAQHVPEGRAGLRLSGTDAAVLLVQSDAGSWQLVHCGF